MTRGLALLFCAWVVALALCFLMLEQAYGATVERHAICWKGNKQVDGPHWKVWRAPPGGWKDTALPCKDSNLYNKGFAVLDENGHVLKIQKHRTYTVPAGPPPEQIAPPDVIANNNTEDG